MDGRTTVKQLKRKEGTEAPVVESVCVHDSRPDAIRGGLTLVRWPCVSSLSLRRACLTGRERSAFRFSYARAV